MKRAAGHGKAGGGGFPGRGRRLRVWVLLAVLVLGVVWALHGVVLPHLLVAVLDFAAGRAGFEVSVGEVRARFDRPLVVRDLHLQAEDGGRSGTVVHAEEVVLQFPLPWKLVGPRGRLLELVEVRGLRVGLDTRAGTGSSAVAMRRPTRKQKEREAGRLLWALPRRIVIDGADFAVEGDASSFAIRDVHAVFDEASLGAMSASGMDAAFGDTRHAFGPQSAVTAWKKGEVFLADMEIRERIRIEQLAVRLASPGGVGADLNAEVFGGLVRGGAFFGEWRGEPGVDATFWTSGLRCGEAAAFAGIAKPVAGTIEEGRVTFRGNPGRVLDAEASMRLVAEGMRWGDREWQSLTISASLINRRLSLTELTLRQEENTVSANAEIALAGKWRDMIDSPFLLNISASIRDMGSLAGLLGPPFDEMTGRMSLRASVSGRSRRLDGFLGMEASEIALRGRHVESARLNLAFKEGEARINDLEIWSGGDRLSGKGSVSIARPHAYSGELDLEVSDVGAYAWVPLDPLPVTSGGITLRWQGDGNANFHSGAFEAALKGLVTDLTPDGISGDFSGTYSPDNIYFGGFTLKHGRLVLTLRASLASSGLKFEEITLKGPGGRLATGEVFLPIDPFALAGGSTYEESLVEGLPLYAALETSGALKLGDLLALAGQEPVASGTVRASVTAGGTIAIPVLDGTVSVTNGSLQPTPSSPRVDRVEVLARFEDRSLRFDRFTGRIGAGPFRVSGSLTLEDLRNPVLDLAIAGDELLLHRDRDAMARANVDLVVRGDATGGRVAGSVKLVDGRILRRLEITPLILAPSGAGGQMMVFEPPRVAIPAPCDAWTLDVRITNATPFTMVGNIASGELVPDLTIGGTLGNPLLSGRVDIHGASACLPFTTLDVADGSISFHRHDPWVPHLDINGKARALEYDIVVHAYGPLSERNVMLRSEPPLSQEEIILLLTAGIAPGEFSGTAFGGALAGQGALLMLRTLAGPFDWRGFDAGSLLNGIPVSTAPPTYPGGDTTLRGTFDLWKGLSLMTEQDESGFYNIGATYRFRFR
jgi:hypothetical protein